MAGTDGQPLVFIDVIAEAAVYIITIAVGVFKIEVAVDFGITGRNGQFVIDFGAFSFSPSEFHSVLSVFCT